MYREGEIDLLKKYMLATKKYDEARKEHPVDMAHPSAFLMMLASLDFTFSRS